VELNHTVYVLDATTIDLCLSVFPWAPFRFAKRQSNCTPCSICGARFDEVNLLDMLIPEPGAFYVMDRANQDFMRWASTGSFSSEKSRSLDSTDRTSSMEAQYQPAELARHTLMVDQK
jgi:hypothetical protein